MIASSSDSSCRRRHLPHLQECGIAPKAILDRLKREAEELESALWQRDSLASQSTDASDDKVESDDARLDSELGFCFVFAAVLS